MASKESTKQVVEKDLIDYEMAKIKPESLFKVGEEICFSSNCPHERKLKLSEQKLATAEQTIIDLKKQVEHYQDKIENFLLGGYGKEGRDGKEGKDNKDGKKAEQAITREQLLQELKDLKESQDIDILRRKADYLNDELKKALAARDEIREQFEGYKRDQEEVLTNYQADTQIQKKISELRVLRARFDVLTQKLSEAELKHKEHQQMVEQYQVFYNQTLVPRYNAMLKELESLNKQSLSRKAELNRLSKIRPMKKLSGTAGGQGRKRFWVIEKLMRWLPAR